MKDRKDFLKLSIEERRKIMEQQSTDLVEYYQTTHLWESEEGEGKWTNTQKTVFKA